MLIKKEGNDVSPQISLEFALTYRKGNNIIYKDLKSKYGKFNIVLNVVSGFKSTW